MNWEGYGKKNRPWSNLHIPTLRDTVICATLHIEQTTVPDGKRGDTVVKMLCYKWKVAGSIPAGVIGIIH